MLFSLDELRFLQELLYTPSLRIASEHVECYLAVRNRVDESVIALAPE